MRVRLQWLVIAATAISALLSVVAHAYVTAALLLIVCAWFVYWSRSAEVARHVLNEWLIALEGKDPYHPDSTPDYQWRGFSTSWCIAISVTNHPTLAASTLILFRDEVEEAMWRAFKTRIAHGPHSLASAARPRKWF